MIQINLCSLSKSILRRWHSALFVVLISAALPFGSANAVTQYLSKDAFLEQAFNASPPTKKTLWLRGETKQKVAELLGQPYSKLRVSYWHEAQRSAWILESKGKVSPITFGYVVENGELKSAKVLIYREHRGWEIHRDAYTAQYLGATLNGTKLSKSIDGISGATLSVAAMNRTAKMALLLASTLE